MNKKAVIVTVYNSENCGSYLQAYALKQILNQKGFEVAFYKRSTQETSHQFTAHIIPFLKAILKLKYQDALFIIGQWFKFEAAIRKFPKCTLKSHFTNEADILILGSDTLWNFDSSYFRKKFNIYSGRIFKGKNIITYAISTANTSLKTFKLTLADYKLSNISSFLVRDFHTKELVEQCTDKKATIVCDPTLLLSFNDYKPLIRNQKIPKAYILLYYFQSFNQEQQNYIIQYAKKHQLNIISLLTYREWCNKSIIASPQNMLFYFSHASYIITDTFHGTAFSLIFEKKFGVFDEGKNKVKELLITYHKTNHLFHDYKNLENTLNQENDVITNGTFDNIRTKSINTLFNTINNLPK